ncbi:MAG: heavy-metal-associated domain-containing protein [Deltaproteobacteria bacterium]|nr:heavy-metal-associated domain-containing protein [Deltaproteobacteria bacterium]
MSDAHTQTWNVTGMTCGGCSGSVERVLKDAPGVGAVKADHAADSVVLTVDGVLDGDEVQRRIEAAGFQVVARG